MFSNIGIQPVLRKVITLANAFPSLSMKILPLL